MHGKAFPENIFILYQADVVLIENIVICPLEYCQTPPPTVTPRYK